MFAWGSRRAGVTLGVTQTIAYAASTYLPAILATRMAADLKVSPAFVFGAFSAALLVLAFLGQPLGRHVDRVGGRGLLVASSLVFAAGLAGLALCDSPIAFCAAWMIMGLGMALGLYDIAFAALVDWFAAEGRRPITGVTLIAGFASTIGWPLTSWVADHQGWRGACLFWAGAHLLIALPLHLSLPPGGARRGNDPGPVRTQPASGEMRAMILLSVAFASAAAVGSAISAHLPPLLIAVGAAPLAALAAATLVGPAQVAARLGEFVIVRRIHPLDSARIALALFPVGAALLLAGGAAFAAPFAILYGCGNGLVTIARGSVPLALFGPAGYGARLGLIAIPGRIAQAAAPFAFALLMQASSSLAIAVFAGLCVLGLGCLLALRR
ncbi:MFS transporter [Caulobacter sp. FWC2]|nr:MFS transporter [Caulobacter sp. FWC2]